MMVKPRIGTVSYVTGHDVHIGHRDSPCVKCYTYDVVYKTGGVSSLPTPNCYQCPSMSVGNSDTFSLRLAVPPLTVGDMCTERKGDATEPPRDARTDGGALRKVQRKGRYDLIPPEALERVAFRFQDALDHYPEDDWKNGMPINKCVDSAMRHIMDYILGRNNEDHLAAAVTNLMMIMWTEQHKPELVHPLRKHIRPWWGPGNKRNSQGGGCE